MSAKETQMTKTKEYVSHMPAFWWLKKRTYFLFMLRELTCVFVGGYAVFLLTLVMRRDDPSAFGALLSSPILIALEILALPFVLYHTITWFNLTPKAIVLFWGEDRISPILIAGPNYLAWLLVSILIAWVATLYG